MIDRRNLLVSIRDSMPEAVIVSQLGDTSNELFEVADSDRNLYLLGSMGMVIPVALGISLSTKVRVVAVEGDGGCLMNLGALTTIARYGPPNLSVLILDNEQYGSTGGQPSATSGRTDIAAVAGVCGITARTFHATENLHQLSDWLLQPELRLAVAKTLPSTNISGFVPVAPESIAQRVRESLETQARHDMKSHRHSPQPTAVI